VAINIPRKTPIIVERITADMETFRERRDI
jgi:hypothetical protein